ncbi:MAG: transposase [Synechococcales bacterium]|nr:transposase [Synechococcales bacterium]
MHLKGFGLVKVFRTVFKNEFRHYIIYQPDPDKIAEITRTQFMDIHALHWQIESFHRAVKQVANIERFFVRQTVAISNHIFAAISAFVHLQLRCIHDLITHCYALKRNLFNDVIHSFIVKNLVDCSYLLPANLLPSVNA